MSRAFYSSAEALVSCVPYFFVSVVGSVNAYTSNKAYSLSYLYISKSFLVLLIKFWASFIILGRFLIIYD